MNFYATGFDPNAGWINPHSIDDSERRAETLRLVLADEGWIDLAGDAAFSDSDGHTVAIDAMNGRPALLALIEELEDRVEDAETASALAMLNRVVAIADRLSVAVDAEVSMRMAGW